MQLFWWFSYKPSEKHWAISPKGKHKLSKTTFSMLQKCLFELNFAFYSGGNYKNCFETFLRTLLGTIRVFFFKCRVTFQLRQFSKATFGTLALYILRLRCLGTSNTYKNRSCFLSKKETFQKDFEYVPKMSLSSARMDFLVVNKRAALRTCWDLSTWNNTCCFFFKGRVPFWLRYFWNATFGILALYILSLRCLAIPNT